MSPSIGSMCTCALPARASRSTTARRRWRRWSSACSPLEPTLVVLEATGGLEVRLVAAALSVAVVNPRQVHSFARAVSWPTRLGTFDKADPVEDKVGDL